ncbi:MAG: hypothetical protein J0M07_24410 [Anaerolineae bacterium]|nr:hypothetical protein [Anaerolineae bacterium]
MKETQAIIERVRRINETHQHLYLAIDPALSGIRAGQSVLARTGSGWTPYLREQWYPVDVQKNTLIVERPAGLRYEPGDVVGLIGAVGQPFKFRKTLRSVLLVAYDSEPTPLLMTIPALLPQKVAVTVLLLGDARKYTTQHLPPEVEVLQGDNDLQWANRVTTVGWADQVFVTTTDQDHYTRVWHLFRELRAEIPANYLWGVFSPTLGCGVGACSACMVKTKDGLHMVCTEGAALDFTKLTWGT